MERVYAVRGAVTLERDAREEVVSRTQVLLRELLERNGITPERIVSIFFTATSDIRSEFPAAAARLMGLDGVPLMCARELDVQSALAMPRTVRILLHFYGDRPPQPVYLGDTARLLEPPEPA